MTQPVLALVGPTAAGKSAVAMEIARRRDDPVEIVAVDAFTVYRGMDVATAKPSLPDRAEVPHHGIDLLDPSVDVSVAWFQRQARAAIASVLDRGTTPLLVGGSGLYFRAVVDDLRFPPTDAEVRARLEHTYAGRPAEAHSRLAELDAAAAAKIQPGNLRRTVRALEVITLTGEPFSRWAVAWKHYDSVYPDLDVACLEAPSDELRQRIDRRANRMLAAGLLDEARALRARPEPLSRTAAQAIGYAEAFAVLDGDLAEDELAGAIARRTRAYARRQRAWFRRDPRCRQTVAATVVARWG